MHTLASLKRQFRRFARVECAPKSPLYEALALRIAEDDELLALCANTQPGQQPANLLFAALQYVASDEPGAAAAMYDASDPQGACEAFRRVALRHRDAVRDLVATRRVQTNAVGRCAFIALGLSRAARLFPGRALALIEIGASAGLNLLVDRYHIDYGDAGTTGPADSTVRLRSRLEGPGDPPQERVPTIRWRVGVDVRPVDLGDADDRRWLRALVWPEQPERAERLDCAIAEFRADPPRVMAADATACLVGLVQEAPAEALPVILHTSVLHQLDADARQRLEEALLRASGHRDLVRVGCDNHGEAHNDLIVQHYTDGRVDGELLAECEPHGRWIRRISHP